MLVVFQFHNMRFLLVSLVGVVSAASKRCLLLSDLEESKLRASFSSFHAELSAQCDGNVQSALFGDTNVRLDAYGDYLYSDLIFVVSDPKSFAFARTEDPRLLAELPANYRQTQMEMAAANSVSLHRSLGGVAAVDVTAFLDSGRNLFMAIQGGEEEAASEPLQALLAQFGFKLLESKVVDLWTHTEDDIVFSHAPIPEEPWTKLVSGNVEAVAYAGAPVGLNKKNANVFCALRASETASHATGESQGMALALVGANQAVNGGRAVLVGSTKVFSDATMRKFPVNKIFTNHVLAWGLGNSHVLRTAPLVHHKVGETHPPRMYKEKELLEVRLSIEEKINGTFRPFHAKDLQVEYVMLDPYWRHPMRFDGKDHVAQFRAPDKNGIFKFKILYNRIGYTPIHIEQVATVRTPKHNDGERFLPCAYPYYGGAFVSAGLVAVFSLLFLNHRSEKAKQHKQE